MRYRGMHDRQVSVYIAALIITMAGSGMAFLILNTINEIDFTSLSVVTS